MPATSTEANKALIRSLYAAINEQDDDELVDRYAPDCVIHRGPGAMAELTGRDGVTQQLQGTREAFPDLTATIKTLIGEHDFVAARITYTGTHEGDYFGVPATGTDVTFAGTNVFRIADGKIAEVWPMIDTLSVFQQLGVNELPEI